MRRRMATAVLGSMVLVLAGCGDDDDEAGDEYCDVARELADSDDTGADDPLFDRYLELAPDEIRDDAAFAIEKIGEEGDEAFSDPDVLEAVEHIEEFEAEECDIQRPDGEDEGGDEADDGTTTDDVDDTDGAEDPDEGTSTTLDETTSTTTEDTSVTTP